MTYVVFSFLHMFKLFGRDFFWKKCVHRMMILSFAFFSNEKFWRVNLDKNQKKKRKHISAQRKILIFFSVPFFFYINSLLLCIIITKAVGNLLWEIWNTKHQLLNPILFFRLHSPQNQLDFLFHWYVYHSVNKSYSKSKTIIFHRVCLEECVSRYNVGRGG